MIRRAGAALAPLLLSLAPIVAIAYLQADPLQRRILRDRAVRRARALADRVTGASTIAWESSPAAVFARTQRDRLIAAELGIGATADSSAPLQVAE